MIVFHFYLYRIRARTLRLHHTFILFFDVHICLGLILCITLLLLVLSAGNSTSCIVEILKLEHEPRHIEISNVDCDFYIVYAHTPHMNAYAIKMRHMLYTHFKTKFLLFNNEHGILYNFFLEYTHFIVEQCAAFLYIYPTITVNIISNYV